MHSQSVCEQVPTNVAFKRLDKFGKFARKPRQKGCKRTRRQQLTCCVLSHQHNLPDQGRRNAAVCYDFHKEVIPYAKHPPVFTLGAGSTEDNLLFDPRDPPLPIFRTERGGEVTYHGPGQLVLYPVINLQNLKPDLHWYLRSLEEVIIRALREVSAIVGERCEGLTGVWVEDKKVAAIGIRARRWISYHGLALNVCTDLSPYSHIIPCGIANKPVTSVAEVIGLSAAAKDSQKLIDEYAAALSKAFQDVFNCELVYQDMPAIFRAKD